MMPQGLGFHFTMMNARIVHAGGANTGIVSTRRAAPNEARYSTRLNVLRQADAFHDDVHHSRA